MCDLCRMWGRIVSCARFLAALGGFFATVQRVNNPLQVGNCWQSAPRSGKPQTEIVGRPPWSAAGPWPTTGSHSTSGARGPRADQGSAPPFPSSKFAERDETNM
jgi:hypothetical protein